MVHIRVEGGRKIGLVARALRHLGDDRTIVNEMTSTLKKLGTPVRQEMKASARSTLPRRGGLNEWVAGTSFRTSVTRSVKSAGVRIIGGRNSKGGRSDIRGIDAGKTRAPLWGNRHHWYQHTVKPGFAQTVFEGPIVDEFRDLALEAVDNAVEKVLRGL